MVSRTATIGTGGLSSAVVAGFAEYVMTDGTSGLIPLSSGIVGAGLSLTGHWLFERHKSKSTPKLLALGIAHGTTAKPSPNQKEKKKEVHELPGAGCQNFTLFQISCLLSDVEPQWPLPTQAARDEFNRLCRAISGDIFGEDLAKELGFRHPDYPPSISDYTERENDPNITIHQIRIDRRQARQYLYSNSRAVPEFLEERFDYVGMPKDEDGGW